MLRKLKKWIYSHEKLCAVVMGVLNLFGFSSRIKGKHPTVWLKHTKVIDKGKGNTIIIKKNSILTHCSFKFFGSNNCVVIGEKCFLNDLTVWIEDNNNRVEIGNKTSVHGKTGLACIEGTRIDIGEDCMFSSNIHFRTGDSHSVLDLEGKRINPSQNIVIGDHVWIGQDVFVGKGSAVPEHSIVAACAVVTKKFDKPNVAIGGNPAKIIKEDVDWSRERL